MKLNLSFFIFLVLLTAMSAEIKVTPATDIHELLANAPEKTILRFSEGDYKISKPLEVTRGTTFLMERGARLVTENNDLIRIMGDGETIIEGLGGYGELVNQETSTASTKNDVYSGVISLEYVPEGARPSLIMKNIIVRGFSGISGMRAKVKGSMNRVEVSSCRFYCTDTHMTHRYSEVQSLKVEDSTFEGQARFGIFFASPMPGGAIIRGNTFYDVGQTAVQLSGGKFSQVADGCMDYLPNAIVENNRILGGGQRAPLSRTYIFGILVYGNNVIVRGNIVKDFNRGEKVPDAPYGHRFKLPDGSYYQGIWIATEKDPHRRMAGAAIYLKANRAIIANNICTNSGWRSVIEVKTGGIGPYALVTGNVVDGTSLSASDSYGFECSADHSVWSNNLVYNMPNCAFAVRHNKLNTCVNNVIHNARIGFQIQGGGRGEILSGNHFRNVEKPYANTNGKSIRMDEEPSIRPVSFQPAGENLLGNPPLKISSDARLLPAWKLHVPTASDNEFIKEGKGEGGFILGGGEKTSNFLLSREMSLKPGAWYRYGGESITEANLSLVIRDGKNMKSVAMNKNNPRASIDFIVTGPSGKVQVQLHGTAYGKEKKAEVKQLTLHLLEEVR